MVDKKHYEIEKIEQMQMIVDKLEKVFEQLERIADRLDKNTVNNSSAVTVCQ